MSGLSFSERMQAGKENAANRRYKGFVVGCHKSWKPAKERRPIVEERRDYHLYLVDQELYALAEYFKHWRDQVQLAHAAVDIALFGEA